MEKEAKTIKSINATLKSRWVFYFFLFFVKKWVFILKYLWQQNEIEGRYLSDLQWGARVLIVEKSKWVFDILIFFLLYKIEFLICRLEQEKRQKRKKNWFVGHNKRKSDRERKREKNKKGKKRKKRKKIDL